MTDVSEMLSSLPDDKIGKFFVAAAKCNFHFFLSWLYFLGTFNDQNIQWTSSSIYCVHGLFVLLFRWTFPLFFLDMIAATSVLQQQAGDIRINKINWQSYMQ